MLPIRNASGRAIGHERQQQGGKQGQDAGEGDPLVDDQVGQLHQAAGHQHQGEDQQAQQDRGKQFPDEIAVDQWRVAWRRHHSAAGKRM